MNILPHHFYSQVPDIRELRRDRSWQRASPMFDVRGTDIDAQVEFVSDCVPAGARAQLAELDVQATAVAESGERGGYGFIEAQFLYCFIQRYRPPRIVQIGCGVSTAIILRAAEEIGYRPEVVCIEPFATDFLRGAHAGKRLTLIAEAAQRVPEITFTDLRPGDFLFVDSTHTVKPGSEVNRIILEILPRLQSGVWVHFHDIYFPYDYQRRILSSELFFNSESTLLHAFLIGNHRFRLVAALSMLHYAAPAALGLIFSSYEPQSSVDGLYDGSGKHFPSAAYLQVM